MFYNIKKINTQGSGEDEPIDIVWVIYIGMKIGYQEKEIKHMYFGKWHDLFEVYKMNHDFGSRKFKQPEDTKVHSLMEL